MTMPWLAVVMLRLALPAIAQGPPDFTGRWARVEASGLTDEWDVADEIAVRSEVFDRTATGAPMRAPLRELLIERRTGGAVRTETVTVGVRGGLVGGITGTGQPSRFRSENAVEWKGDRLLIWGSTTAIADDGTERVSERAQEWSLDTNGQLVIAVRTRAPGEESRRGRLVYRRVP